MIQRYEQKLKLIALKLAFPSKTPQSLTPTKNAASHLASYPESHLRASPPSSPPPQKHHAAMRSINLPASSSLASTSPTDQSDIPPGPDTIPKHTKNVSKETAPAHLPGSPYRQIKGPWEGMVEGGETGLGFTP